jgi:hypothetical protein
MPWLVVWQILNNISEESAASIFRVFGYDGAQISRYIKRFLQNTGTYLQMLRGLIPEDEVDTCAFLQRLYTSFVGRKTEEAIHTSYLSITAWYSRGTNLTQPFRYLYNTDCD